MNRQQDSTGTAIGTSGNPPQKKLVRFIKRIGVVGFLFFLGKGLLWLLVPYLIATLF